MIIDELVTLEQRWNLRLNKKKSEILTKETVEEVNGIRCGPSSTWELKLNVIAKNR